jgi:putative hydrolase of the HAD superfamily
MSATPITHLFLDIGGVLLTNGWDRHCRRDAAQSFALDLEDLNDRHKMSFDTYEEGKLNLTPNSTSWFFTGSGPLPGRTSKSSCSPSHSPKLR